MSRTPYSIKLLHIALAAALLSASAANADTRAQRSSAATRQVKAEAHSEGRAPQVSGSKLPPLPAHTNAAGVMAKPTADQVGDADTFGRNVVWDGLINTGTITMAADCTPQPGDPAPGPDDRCITIAPGTALTPIDLPDIGRMTLPAKSSHNILCHWLSPIVIYSLYNNTGASATGRITLSPYLKVESEVLNDPGMIDPTTGLPFNGALETSFSASYQDARTLAAGDRATERFSDSRVCIGGTISRQGLIQGYGLTDAQVDKFFKKPMTLRFGLRGSASLVDFASIIYGLRIMGD
ncbi:MAG TPA: hypothetical protein VGH80_14000 [Xanthomonadaceae bacterium]|jgi:hypothetical protein